MFIYLFLFTFNYQRKVSVNFVFCSSCILQF